MHDPPRPDVDHPIDMKDRFLGPNNRRDILVHAVTPDWVFPVPGEGWGGLEAGRQRPSVPDGRELEAGDSRHIIPPGAGDVRPDGSFIHPDIPGLRISARVKTARGTLVDFLPPDEAMWMVPLNSRSYANPYMFMAGASQLWVARRNNASHPAPGQTGPRRPQYHPRSSSANSNSNGDSDEGGGVPSAAWQLAAGASSGMGWGSHPMDGWVHPAPPNSALYHDSTNGGWYGTQRHIFRSRRVTATHGRSSSSSSSSSTSGNTASWVSGSQWGPLPSMDTVIFLGIGGEDIRGTFNLSTWLKGSLGLLVQNHTRAYFADLRKNYRKEHLLCARTGVWSSQKPRVFSSHTDAWMFRAAAYRAAGLQGKGLSPHPRHPPRTITVLDRKGQHGRSYFNPGDVLAAAHATGLPVTVIPAMHELSWAAQVEAMARTGILVAPHGAALANLMFLPQHAVVIEVSLPACHARYGAGGNGVRMCAGHTVTDVSTAAHQQTAAFFLVGPLNV